MRSPGQARGWPNEGGLDAARVSVVIVSWNVRDLLRRCLTSVFRELGAADGEVWVVDNASTDDSVTMLEKEFPRVKVIANPENLGFVRANNQALSLCRGDYVLLLNPDAELAEGSLARMLAVARAEPGVGMVGPRLVYADGSPQPSRRRFPSLRTAMVESTALNRLPGAGAMLRRFYLADVPDDVDQDVDWLVGACLLVRKAVLDTVGRFDERFFMYSEEVDLCLRLRAAGWRVRYTPGAVVVHHEARSSEQAPFARHFHFHDSRCRYFGKHRGRWAERLLRAVVVANYAFLCAEDLAKLALRHKPALRRRRAWVYAEVCRRLLRELVRR